MVNSYRNKEEQMEPDPMPKKPSRIKAFFSKNSYIFFLLSAISILSFLIMMAVRSNHKIDLAIAGQKACENNQILHVKELEFDQYRVTCSESGKVIEHIVNLSPR